MLSMGTPFILSLLTILASSDEALAQERALDDFANSCFRDPSAIDWRLRALWRGMGSYVGREQRRFATTREQDPSGLFRLASGKAVDVSTQQSVPPLPTLVQIGKEDAQIYTDKLEAAMREHYRDMEFVVLPERGHSIHVEAQDEVMERILDFAGRVLRLPTLSLSSSEGDVRDSSEEDSDEQERDERVLRSKSSSASLFRTLNTLRHTFRSTLGYR